MYLRLPTSFAVIFGSFTLGLYVAIQGPTLMDLIDLLHVNNDIMSYSLAFASLAYSVGGLLSGFLFNYVNRQLLIASYFMIFGIANIATPYLSNFMVFSVINVFKMMCAGGTDCGANVWILEMWPGQDSWLQALHFSFAVGCALGPLIVEPFLSVEHEKVSDPGLLGGQLTATAIINDQNNETRIHIPYAVSGLACITASVSIVWLYYLQERHKKLKQKARANDPEHIALKVTSKRSIVDQSPPQLKSAQQQQEPNQQESQQQQQSQQPPQQQPLLPQEPPKSQPQQQQPPPEDLEGPRELTVVLAEEPQVANSSAPGRDDNGQVSGEQLSQMTDKPPVKITSKAREQVVGRPPYYVMFAIALAAMCLSFYCGIEITSMNYLATFAVNIDLQLPKSTAALMSSALTISFAVGRAFAIWIAAYMKPHKLFYLCVSIMATGNVLMLIFANTAEKLLWYSICLFGIGCGPMFPSIVSFYDDKIAKVTNTVSGIFISGSMFNVALNSLIIGHHIIDNALILIVCNLVGSVVLFLLFGTLHMLTKVKKHQRVRKFRLKQQAAVTNTTTTPTTATTTNNNNPTTTNTTNAPVSVSTTNIIK